MKRYVRTDSITDSQNFAKNATADDIYRLFYEGKDNRYRASLGQYLGKNIDEAKAYLPKTAVQLNEDDYDMLSSGDLFLAFSRYYEKFFIFRCDSTRSGRCEDSIANGYDLWFRSDKYPYVWVERRNETYYPLYVVK